MRNFRNLPRNTFYAILVTTTSQVIFNQIFISQENSEAKKKQLEIIQKEFEVSYDSVSYINEKRELMDSIASRGKDFNQDEINNIIKQFNIVQKNNDLLLINGFIENLKTVRPRKFDTKKHINKLIPLNLKEQIKDGDESCANITIDNATLDFVPFSGEDWHDPKNQWVRFQVTITSACDSPFTFYSTEFYIRTSDGTTNSTTYNLDSTFCPDIHYGVKILSKGQSITRALYYDIDSKETLKTLSILIKGYWFSNDPFEFHDYYEKIKLNETVVK